MDKNVTRRHAISVAALAGAGVAVAACSGGGDTTAAPAAPAGSSAPAAGGGALTTTAEVPVGGGVILGEVVVVQPEAGTFKGFSPTCTHQGCKVTSVADSQIVCPCHGSQFSIADGSVTSGPATTPLPEVPIKVDGTNITLA
ncbi:Rieske iron-sulfur protein [Acrocarpospora pleiomorpha]|uniref:Cytochrome bc1 complex Rieske iron-sulfur subunit n=1 Tax=Acrocarpospora pleiomorpha TaxID=90975 RepID=A0A5M3XBR6_9ACTN|nr:Rieske (2Fe-2S) protein [Acrocarpospora pleiomorpha]GES18570.1 Rieske iron-sulfur protein [Acrocarpospora pleiomorpha]